MPPQFAKILEGVPEQDDGAKRASWMVAYRGLLEARLRVREGDDTPEYQAILLELCRRDPIFFINTFGIITNPRNAAQEEPTRLPFVLYPFQREIVRFLHESLTRGGNRLIPKSRDMGVTWTSLWLIVWGWLFVPGFTAHLGSRIKDYVDLNPGSRNPDTLFGKVELILDSLPAYLLPPGFDMKNARLRQYGQLVNPQNGNRLSGEASSPNFARGGRWTVVLMDEGDHWPDTEASVSAAQDAAFTRWIVTTPNPYGSGTIRRMLDEKLADVLTIHWSAHPLKDLAWYQGVARERFKDRLAQELDLSWAANQELTVYPEWQTVPKGSYPYMPGWPTYCAIDFGRSDGTGIVWLQVDPKSRRARFLGSYYNRGELIDFYLPMLGHDLPSGPHLYTEADRAFGRWAREWKASGPVTYFGDPAGHQKTQASNDSVIEVLARHRVYVQTTGRISRFEERISRARLLLRNAEVNIDLCASLDASMRDYRYRKETRNQVQPARKPLHNDASHLCTAVEYAAENLAVTSAAPVRTLARHQAAWE